MSEFILIGALLGAAVGLLHLAHTLATRLGQPELNPIKTLWQGLWVFLLWTAFGAYVLAFWIVGLVCMAVSRLRGSRLGAS